MVHATQRGRDMSDDEEEEDEEDEEERSRKFEAR